MTDLYSVQSREGATKRKAPLTPEEKQAWSAKIAKQKEEDAIIAEHKAKEDRRKEKFKRWCSRNGLKSQQQRHGGQILEETGTLITVRQEHFLMEYMIDFDLARAMAKAQIIHKKVAVRILNKHHSRLFMQERMNELKEKSLVDEEMVVRGLIKEAKDMEFGSPGSRVTAWTQLGRHLAMFTDKKTVDSKIAIESVIADLPALEDDAIEGDYIESFNVVSIDDIDRI
jgi:hypothetical protein|tara:strand:+ start:66 stop:746 length:681 start_codon:yes stop_codon:yes gene_type:complete